MISFLKKKNLIDLVFLNIFVLYSKSPLYLKVFTHIVQEGKEGHPPLCLPEPPTHEGSLVTSLHRHPAVQASLVTVRGRNRSGAAWRDLSGASGSFEGENGSNLRLLEAAAEHRATSGHLNFLYPREAWGFLVAQSVKNLPAVRETPVQSLGGEDPWEKGRATHSRILAWRTPWTEEPGGLQPIGSQSRTRLSS